MHLITARYVKRRRRYCTTDDIRKNTTLKPGSCAYLSTRVRRYMLGVTPTFRLKALWNALSVS